jgi:two-component system phosphate regulon sensor histidine kinase PhoR
LTVGIITLDKRGHVSSANAAAADMFELGAREPIGRALIELVPSFVLDQRAREAVGGRSWRGQVPLTATHTTRMLTVTALPVEGGGGAILIASDETRLHELERNRHDFVSSVSHELRTPLSSINLMIETILSTGFDPDALEMFLPRVKHEVDRMVHLVEDLLDLARAEAGRLRLRREVVNLASVAANILKTFEPKAQQLGVSLVQQGGDAQIDGDPDRLAQVVVNLVDNALRHTPAGGTVTLEVAPSEGASTLVVRDTGAGIPYNDLPRIFERFYVVDRSRSRESAGTGLGLSIVKQIVEAHGGTVTADSEFGLGATFRCVFPSARSALREPR